jgi:hypothetical protein
MPLRGRLIWLAVAAVALFLLNFASLASACNEPAIGVSRTQASPGEIVPFSFTGTDTDATYTVSVEGQTVASGASSGPTVSGTFVMPNLGSNTMRVNVEGFVSDPTESAYGWPSSAAIQYVPPAPPPAPTSSAPQPAPAPQASSSAPTSQAASPTPSAPATGGGPAPTPPPGPGPGHTPPAGPRPSSHPPGHLRAGTSPGAPSSSSRSFRASQVSHTTTASAAPSAPTTTAAPHVGARSGGSAGLSQRGRSARAVRIRGAQVASVDRGFRPSGVVGSASARRPDNAGTRKATDDVVTLLAVTLLGLMALGGGGAAAARMRRRRRPKNSPFTAAVARLAAAEPASDADAMLDGLDLDAELRSILAQADGRAPEEVAEADRSAELVPTPS